MKKKIPPAWSNIQVGGKFFNTEDLKLFLLIDKNGF